MRLGCPDGQLFPDQDAWRISHGAQRNGFKARNASENARWRTSASTAACDGYSTASREPRPQSRSVRRSDPDASDLLRRDRTWRSKRDAQESGEGLGRFGRAAFEADCRGRKGSLQPSEFTRESVGQRALPGPTVLFASSSATKRYCFRPRSGRPCLGAHCRRERPMRFSQERKIKIDV